MIWVTRFADPFWQAFRPALPPPNLREALRSACGVTLGLLATHAALWALSRAIGVPDAGFLAHPMLIAPMGASAVLVYAVPASPLAQPWSVVVGNTAAAALALAVLALGLAPVVSLCLAALCAMAGMMALRALHPPGGAVAVATVLAASSGAKLGLDYLALTVLAGSALLVGFGVLYNRLTRRPYPSRPAPAPAPSPERRHAPTPLALAAALDRLRLGANLGVDDLAQLIETAETMVVSQEIGLSAAEIMTSDPVTVRPESDWRSLAALVVEHGFRSLPVTDELGRYLGLVPVAFLLRPGAQGLTARHLMETVAAQSPEATLADILPPLAQGRQVALPVVEADGALAGIITRSDIVASLVHAMAHP